MRVHIVLILLAIASTCLAGLYGGYDQQPVEGENQSKVLELIQTANNVNENSLASKVLADKPKLVFYAIQLVSGLNHGIVFENNGSFTCFRLYAVSWSNIHTITESKIGDSLSEVLSKCGISSDVNSA